MLSPATNQCTVQQLLLSHYTPETNTPVHVQNVLNRIMRCRTASLGYHVYKCSNGDCGYIKYQYHSCRDRHCPGCGALKKQDWIEARMQELLPVKYFHVVFTLPHELNSLILGNRKALFKLLFDSSAATLLAFAKDPVYLNALPGIISVLHTWGQQLSFHPHIHCIVSGGGIRKDNTWCNAKKSCYRFLFPVTAMQQVFRGKFLQSLKQLIAEGEVVPPDNTDVKKLINVLYSKDWVVYAKPPFAGPQTVIEYLGRYTHKVAISNHRICSIDHRQSEVTFEYKDYADNNSKKLMTLSVAEFVRRFKQHILPGKFTKIRTYGYLSNRNRKQRINDILTHMNLPLHKGMVKVPLKLILVERFGIDIEHCSCCGNSTMKLIAITYHNERIDDS